MTDSTTTPLLVDRFGRHVNYLRVSVTDRCDFRCVYCMSEDTEFVKRSEILTLEEIAFIVSAFTQLGVTKIRITGGEPLVRRDIIWLLSEINTFDGLRECVLTTNGSQLARLASDIHRAGVSRINISLDSLDATRFKQMSRVGDLARVLEGIYTANTLGFKRIRINSVILKNYNHDEVSNLVAFAIEHNLDIAFIEEMPLGIINQHDRAVSYYSSDDIKTDLEKSFQLLSDDRYSDNEYPGNNLSHNKHSDNTYSGNNYSDNNYSDNNSGPARYYRVAGTSTRVGFISPHSHNFCSQCNRVRLTTEGRLLLCLGQEHSMDLKQVIRSHPGNIDILKQAIIESMAIKPLGHNFNIHEQPVVLRHMNATGG